MVRVNRSEGRNKDFPLLNSVIIVAATTGTGSDFETPIMAIPNLAALYATGLKGAVPINNCKVRTINLLSSATITGANTNNFTLNVRQWRAGAALAGILGTVTFASGTNAAINTAIQITPLAGNKLLPGDVVTIQRVSIGTGLASPLFTVQIEFDPA